MRESLAIVLASLLLLSLVSCRKGDKESSSQPESSPNSSPSSATSSSSTGDKKADSSTQTTSPSKTKTTSGSKTTSPSKTKTTSKTKPSSDATTSSSKESPSSSSTTSYIAPDADNGPRFRIINYDVNGQNIVKTAFDTDYWKMPYGREDDGTITRNGYVLLGYSYDKNGNGELIRPGYKYNLRTADTYQTLYCVWARETNPANFKTTQNNDGTVSITAYTGSDKVVYIPRTINKKTVTGIASGAFANNGALTEVHITSSIRVVEKNAFASCRNLKTVTLYDNLKTISNTSFTNSPVKTVRLCAGKTPRYADSTQTFGIKYERLIKTRGQKRIIVVAGSSALFGIDSDYMESLFQDTYTVVNFGTNGNMNILFYLDAILPHLTKNDIVVFAPEQYGPYAYHTNGNPEIPAVTLQGVSTCYNLFENIDVSTYTNVFGAIGQYCTESARMPEQSWEDHSEKIDKLGDHGALAKSFNSADFRYGANGYFRFDKSVIPSQHIPNLNRVIDNAKKTGAVVLFSYPPYNKNNIQKESLDEKSYDFYNDWIAKTVHCPLISDVRNYIYSGIYFSNTDYHLNGYGRELHTKRLAQDIIDANIGVK